MSVIVPVHNWNDLVYQAISSVRAQSYPAVEIIVVAPLPPPIDINVQLCITDVLEGPGISRNIGMNAARGEYITFVDSDDLALDNMIEKLITFAIDNEADVVVSPILELLKDKRVTPTYNCSIYTKMGLSLFEDSSLFGKLFRTRFLQENKITFPNKMYGEDMHFVYQAYLSATTIVACYDSLYLHRQHSSSLLCTIDSYGLKEVADCYEYFCDHEKIDDIVKKIIRKKVLNILFVHLISFSRLERTKFFSWKDEIQVLNNSFGQARVYVASLLRTISCHIFPHLLRSAFSRIFVKVFGV